MADKTPEPPLRESFNINFVKDHIKLFKETINNMKNQGNHNIVDHELQIIEDYPEFYQSYPFLVKKVCKGDDLDMLEVMFKKLELVESGEKSLENVENKLGKELASQYLTPAINKK